MDTPIRITAQPSEHDPAACAFVVDRPVFAGGFARFRDAEQAKGSPLAARLLAVPGIIGADISGSTVTVIKSGAQGWREIGPAIGAAIRAHLQSGDPAVSPEALKNLPPEDKLRSQVQRILDEQINPAVAGHGGKISLVDVQGNRVFIKMGGGCQGCGAADTTLRQGVERTLREQVPGVGEILDVSDHAAGTNPYYARH